MSFIAFGQHLTVDLPGARTLFTTRRGGVSPAPYDTLNLGLGTGDDPDRVRINRERLETELGVRLAGGRQVHGATVSVVDQEAGQVVEADGFATSAAGVAPLVLTADCLPIAIAGDGAVAMLHAGWRGLQDGVIAAGVQAVRELAHGRAGGNLSAALGPGAGVCCYEVGDELLARFGGYGSEVRRGRNLDLKLIARRQLEAAGIAQVHDCELCTICAPASMFFSHRRDRGRTGRQAGIAWLS